MALLNDARLCLTPRYETVFPPIFNYFFKPFMEKKLHVNVSIPATRLFIGSIPKDKSKQEFEQELTNMGVSTVSFLLVISDIKFAETAKVVASIREFSNRFAGWKAVVCVSRVGAVAALELLNEKVVRQ